MALNSRLMGCIRCMNSMTVNIPRQSLQSLRRTSTLQIYVKYYHSNHGNSGSHFRGIQKPQQIYAGIQNSYRKSIHKVLFPSIDRRYVLCSHHANVWINSNFQICAYCTASNDKIDKKLNNLFDRYCDSLLDEYNELSKLSQTEQLKPNAKKRLHHLRLRTEDIHEIKRTQRDYEDLLEMKKEYGSIGENQELRDMIKEEVMECEKQLTELRDQLKFILLPEETVDRNDVILEATSAVGGQESMLFTKEIFNMYRNYAIYKGWTFDLLSEKNEDAHHLGGTKSAAASICGDDVYKLLKWEAGVHRVQRVPKTDKSGRVHTSTMTVSVVPQPTEIEIAIQTKDLKIDTFKASGAGGQHVNTTSSAVRITHLPTGMKVECQQERSQIQNRDIAMKRLRANLYQVQLDQQMSKAYSQKKLQVGTAGRSEKIRTYNYNQDRITDHRIYFSCHGIDDFLSGGELLDELIEKLNETARTESFQEMLYEFEMKEKDKLKNSTKEGKVS